MRWFALFLFVLIGPFAGCEKNAPPVQSMDAPAPSAPTQHQYPTKAQPHLQTIRLWLGPAELETELALTPIQEETGMMFRTNMPEETAMLFVFPSPYQASFWMKNTILPLSAGYIDPEGNLLEIHDLKPQDTNAVVAKTPNIQYVLEVNQGWFQRHHIEVGTLVRTEFGTLRQTFTTQRR